MSDGSAAAYKKDFSGFAALFEDGVLHTPGQEYFHARVPETDLYLGAISPDHHRIRMGLRTLQQPAQNYGCCTALIDSVHWKINARRGPTSRCRSNLKFSKAGLPALAAIL